MKKKMIRLMTGLLIGITAQSTSAATLADSPADLIWTNSGGASSSVSGDVLSITAAKNSQVLASLPSTVTLAETNDALTVSFEVTITGSAFADDGSALKIGFNDSSNAYSYAVAIEPYGGDNQAVFSETDDFNLGKFDVSAMGSDTWTVSFELTKTDTSAGLELTATGSVVSAGSVSVEPDIIPATTTSFDEISLNFTGSQWLNAQTVTVENLRIEAPEPTSPPPATNAFVNTPSELTWTDSNGAASSVSNDVLIITASKNSSVEAALPSTVSLETTNDYLLVSFDVDIAGTAFADDGSAFRIGFRDSSDPYDYSVAFEPYGGANQAVFSETDDPNLGKFDICAMSNTQHLVMFALKKTATSAGLKLEAVSDLITDTDYTQAAEPDVLPLTTTSFDEIYFHFSGNQWLNNQTVTIEDFTIETLSSTNSTPAPEPSIPGNLLVNGDMESGDIGWSDDGQHAIVTGVVHSGNASLQYVATDNFAGLQQIDVIGGRDYNVSGWIKTDYSYSGNASIVLDCRDQDNNNLGFTTVGTVSAGTDWTQLSYTITVPTNTVLMKINLKTYSNSGLCWFDDLSVIQTNQPTDAAITAPANPPIAGTWTATFEDNFNGGIIDGTKWKLGTYAAFINGNAGNSADCFSVSNGAVTIHGKLEPVEFGGVDFDYSAGEMSSIKRFRQLYGYFEVRMRYECTLGMFPAFWTMPDRGWYGNEDNNHKSLIKFDVSSLSTPVSSAQLRLRVNSVQDLSKTLLNVYKLDDNWSEYSVTWNNMPTEDPIWLIHDDNVTGTNGQEIVYDLTDYINEQIAEDGTASLVIYDTFSRSQQTTFHSREAASAADRPRLVINGTTTLEPVADATVRQGVYADSNYGATSLLSVEEDWKRNNCTTYITTNASGIIEKGMEMDIFEDVGSWGTYELHSALHWDGYAADHQSQSFSFNDPTFSVEEYHTYGMYWEEGLIEYYVDGQLTGRFSNSRACTTPSYLILSLQMGGWWPNTDTNSWVESDYPAAMDVDYVKVWSGTKQ